MQTPTATPIATGTAALELDAESDDTYGVCVVEAVIVTVVAAMVVVIAEGTVRQSLEGLSPALEAANTWNIPSKVLP